MGLISRNIIGICDGCEREWNTNTPDSGIAIRNLLLADWVHCTFKVNPNAKPQRRPSLLCPTCWRSFKDLLTTLWRNNQDNIAITEQEQGVS